MTAYALYAPPPRARGGPRLDARRLQRNAVLVQRFAAGETYTDLSRTFGLGVQHVNRIVHRYAYEADPAQYWALLRAHGHTITLPQKQLRAHIQALRARAEAGDA